ncbi:hypothetical protein ACFVXG_31535 [Kitasatospora sp. NPDC058162]|uniref:hypothetical protein n=1 Tax=Kitasatospora sp. NPDC058162 TaxID=3346362 RepID=UPI0036DD930E
MDSGIRAMVDAVDEARRQLRENALPKAKEAGRDRIPEGEDAELLGALAALVKAAGDLADAVGDRVVSRDTCKTYARAARRLEREAANLSGDRHDAAKRAG